MYRTALQLLLSTRTKDLTREEAILKTLTFRRGPGVVLTTDESVPFHMKLPPLQDIAFVHVLACSIFRMGPCFVLTTD